ncbi:LOW QUALITY PROTEIN: hypothetical protein OSB04_005670, partial [Centaurea solstitialis]
MPYNIWCGGCNSMIAKGVRFNAEKKQVGNYYSTKYCLFYDLEKIFNCDRFALLSGVVHGDGHYSPHYYLHPFASIPSDDDSCSPCSDMELHHESASCKQEIVIQTDPKNCEYLVISGAQKKVEEFDTEDAETMALPVDEEKSKLSDPFYRLEHQEEDLKKKKEAEPLLVRLQRLSDARHLDDYSLNKSLRAKLRSQKKRVAEEEVAARKMGLGIRLLPASEEDTAAAKRVKFSSKFNKNRDEKRALIKSASIFSGSSSSSSRRLELQSKRRRINAATASELLVGDLSRHHGHGFPQLRLVRKDREAW